MIVICLAPKNQSTNAQLDVLEFLLQPLQSPLTGLHEMPDTVSQKKICILGDFAVGKTSLIQRFVYSTFDEKYLSTIGVTISQKDIRTSPDVSIRLILWDLSGSDQFNGRRTSYLAGASGAFLVCDLSREETINSLMSYREQLGTIAPNAAFVLIGNKMDLLDSAPQQENNLNDIAGLLDCRYFLTSAKTGLNIEESFLHLAKKLV